MTVECYIGGTPHICKVAKKNLKSVWVYYNGSIIKRHRVKHRVKVWSFID